MLVVLEGVCQLIFNINLIYGGQVEGVEDFIGLLSFCVFDSCCMVIDCCFLLEEDIDDVQVEVMDVLKMVEECREKFCYDVCELYRVLLMMMDRDVLVVQIVVRVIEVMMGVEL